MMIHLANIGSQVAFICTNDFMNTTLCYMTLACISKQNIGIYLEPWYMKWIKAIDVFTSHKYPPPSLTHTHTLLYIHYIALRIRAASLREQSWGSPSTNKVEEASGGRASMPPRRTSGSKAPPFTPSPVCRPPMPTSSGPMRPPIKEVSSGRRPKERGPIPPPLPIGPKVGPSPMSLPLKPPP